MEYIWKITIITILFCSLIAAQEAETLVKECPPSKYEIAGVCVDCENGHYCPGGLSGQIKCPEGQYSKWALFQGDRTQCLPCPAGTYQDKKGKEKCISCPPYHQCDYPGLTDPIPCNKPSNYESKSQFTEGGWCNMSMIQQVDKNAYIQSIAQIDGAVVDKVYRLQRPLAKITFQYGIISHSGLLIQDKAGKFYQVQLEIIRHKNQPSIWGYGDIFVDECPGLEIKTNEKGQLIFDWWQFHYIITDGPYTPVTGEWSILDSYLRMVRSSYGKYEGRYYWALNNCHEVEIDVRKAMGILN